MGPNYSKFISALDPLLPFSASDNNKRLIRTRWIAGIMVFVATAICKHVLNIPLAERELYFLGGFILSYNIVMLWLTRYVYIEERAIYRRRIYRLILWQILFDWFSMGVLLHLTGGITSPATPIFFIHVLLVTILLPVYTPFYHAWLAIAVISVIALLEATSVLHHYVIIPDLPGDLHTNTHYIAGQIVFFAVGLFATVYVSKAVMDRLREHERQISALLLTTKAVSSSLELNEVLNRLAENTAEALSIPAASIRLLDARGDRLRIVGSYGLSQAYLDKGHVLLSQSRLDRDALAGRGVMVTHAHADPRIQYPKEVVQEGIRSMLVVPIIGQRPLGVLRAYAYESDFFKAEQIDFMMAIARQGAAAIENAMAHAALQKAEAQRSQFVHIVTHELRAPVTGAQSLVRVLVGNLAGELTEQQTDIISRLGRRMDSLLVLINDLLSLAESRAVELQEPFASVPVQQTIQTIIEQLSYQAKEKQITLDTEMPDHTLQVSVSPDGLKRVFDNLIGNAVKYTPDGGRVWVKVAEQSPHVMIAIKDTGIGIPEDAIERLGEEFFRAPNARQSGIIGTGLGLTVSKQLIDHFQGHMTIQSVVDQGTTVTVLLPQA